MNMKKIAGWSMLTPLVGGLTIFALYPFAFLIFLSVSNSTLANQFKSWVGFENFTWAFEGTAFPESVVRTVVFAITISTIQMLLGLLVAVFLHNSIHSGKIVRSIILLPLMTPPVAVGVAWKLLLNSNGWLNTALISMGIINDPIAFLGNSTYALPAIMMADTWQWTPFIVILIFAALQSLPKSVFEAARLDGAYNAQIFFKITLPMLVPSLLAIFLIRLIMAFKTFDLVYILTFGGPGNSTNIATFEIWKTAMREFDLGLAAAQTLILAIVISLVTLPIVLMHKYSEQN